MGRALRRREARPQQGRQVLLLPRLLGRRADDALPGQRKEMGRAAEAVPVGAAGGVQRGGAVDAGQVRRAEPGGAAQAGRGGNPVAAVLARGARGLREGILRAICRVRDQEPPLQAHLWGLEEVPRRAVPLVPRRRAGLRQLRVQLQGRSAGGREGKGQDGLIKSRRKNKKPRFGGVFLFLWRAQMRRGCFFPVLLVLFLVLLEL